MHVCGYCQTTLTDTDRVPGPTSHVSQCQAKWQAKQDALPVFGYFGEGKYHERFIDGTIFGFNYYPNPDGTVRVTVYRGFDDEPIHDITFKD